MKKQKNKGKIKVSTTKEEFMLVLKKVSKKVTPSELSPSKTRT